MKTDCASSLNTLSLAKACYWQPAWLWLADLFNQSKYI